jgi:tRNA 2-thiouridine synthesizing protein A
MDDRLHDQSSLAAQIAALTEKVDRFSGKPCCDCSQPLDGHSVLFSIASGTGDAPRCLSCLAQSLNRDMVELSEHLQQHFRHRPCYTAAWNLVTEREGRGRRLTLATSVSTDSAVEFHAPKSTLSEADALQSAHSKVESAHATVEWDAGDLACGDLLLQLRMRLRSLEPGTIVVLTARDRGAVEDIPAWCGLTGHRLLSQDHPVYRIQRKFE